jgi:hypothetical protein
MGFQRKRTQRTRARVGRVFRVELLEQRALLAASTETFSAPSLTDLIAEARQGQDTAPAAIDRVLDSLESQLTSGPLADLTGGTVDGNGFVTEVQSLESSYSASLDSQLLPEFPNVDTLLQLQGQRIVADVTSLNQQSAVGLISSSDLATQAQTAINALTAGPLFSLQTPLSGYASATQAFESELNTLAQSLSSSATTTVTPAQASTTMLAETLAYQTDIHASAQVTHPNISNMVDGAVIDLENTASSIATLSSSDAQTAISTAVNTFDTAILDTSGVFGPSGVISDSITSGRGFAPQVTDTRDGSSLTAVSGTASSGTATLTATLTTSTGTGISGVAVFFTLDGAFAGIAATDSSGVATLSNVPTSDVAGTDTNGVVAYFAGNIQEKSSIASGDLTVAGIATSVGSVSGTANFGGTATLVATLTSSATSAGVSGESVAFTLDGTSVGSATTNSSGVATLTGVTTTDAVGSAGVVVASFAGDSTYAASSGTGSLTVAQAATTLSAVSGTASFGGTATLTATLTSSVTGLGVSGQTVSFTLDGGTAVTGTTNSSGVATVTVATTDPVGSTGVVVASFAGDTNFSAAANVTGSLTVSPADTTFSSVAGILSSGTANLSATLTSSVTGQPISGVSVEFTIGTTDVGPATTNSSGIATLSVSTTEPSGTAVSVAFAGNTDYNSGSGSGTLT